MRVLAITQRLRAIERETESLAERTRAIRGAEVVRNRAIISGDATERLARQSPSRSGGDRASIFVELAHKGGVIGRLDHDRDVGAIFGGGGYQRRAPAI